MHCTEHHQWRDERRKWRDVAERPLAQRWWEDTRGGAQVEGAMAVLFLAMMFAAFLWYQHVTYVELATVREAGRELWEPALNGCEEGSPAEAQEWVGGYRGVQAELAPAAGEQLSDILLELKQKATAAADPSQSAATRASYNQEFQSLLSSIQSFADNAIFDGANILDGTATTDLTFLASADGNETIAMKRQNLTLVGLGLAANSYDSNTATAAIDAWTNNAGTPEDETLLNAAPDLLTQEKAKFALQRVDDAIAVASSRLSELGAQAKQIERHTTYVGKLSDSLEAGIGNLVDADLAKESARLQALQVQQQLGVQALSIANQAPQMILSLFQN